jgi:hypothetical protein
MRHLLFLELQLDPSLHFTLPQLAKHLQYFFYNFLIDLLPTNFSIFQLFEFFSLKIFSIFHLKIINLLQWRILKTFGHPEVFCKLHFVHPNLDFAMLGQSISICLSLIKALLFSMRFQKSLWIYIRGQVELIILYSFLKNFQFQFF